MNSNSFFNTERTDVENADGENSPSRVPIRKKLCTNVKDLSGFFFRKKDNFFFRLFKPIMSLYCREFFADFNGIFLFFLNLFNYC